MADDKLQQVAQQCRVVAHLAKSLMEVHQDYATIFASGDKGPADIADSRWCAHRMLAALGQQRAWVQHWIDDVAAGLTPTPESLSKALADIDTALSKATPS